ncbi:MAG: putative Ig domain-containing protein, partial [Dehalococcoidia bacterium]
PLPALVFIVPDPLPEATLGVPYEYSFCQPHPPYPTSGLHCGDLIDDPGIMNPRGGDQPYTFRLKIFGDLPFGMTLDTNGILRGTPDPRTRPGAFQFEVCVTDYSGVEVCQPTSITVLEPAVQGWELTIEFASGYTFTHTLTVEADGSFTGTRDNPASPAPYCEDDPYTLSGSFTDSQVSWTGVLPSSCLVNGQETDLSIIDTAEGEADAPFPQVTSASGSGTAQTWLLISGEPGRGYREVEPFTDSFTWTASRIE